MKSYSAYQFSLFRIILGIYLVWHFALLIPYAGEIWSNQGIFPDPNINLTYGFLPNILSVITTPLAVALYIGLLTLLSCSFTLGYQRQITAILLWYGWATLFDRNNLISNPGIPYVGWLLLCCSVIPKGEPWSYRSETKLETWKMPPILYLGAWILMAVGYTISGFDKFASPSWRDGSAILHLLENPLARDSFLRDLAVTLPEGVIKLKTWSVLVLEMAFLPLALIPFTRKWIWLAMILMHIGILTIVDFADLTLGMLMIHWFTFDSSWLKAKPRHTGVLFFDGVCGVCNSIVDFLMPIDQNDTLRFAPLQGSTASQEIDSKYITELKTIVYKEGSKVYSESDAVINAISNLGGIWKLILISKCIPKIIRDKLYRFISKNRYKWFGKKDACRMPTPEEREKILP